MTLPVVQVSGEPYEQGRQHGIALHDEIAHNLAVYFDRFQSEVRLEPAAARARAAAYFDVLAGQPYLEALRGLAEGSGHPILDLLVLNVRYELLYYQYGILPSGGGDGCTAAAVLPAASANGHLLLGQNWDWIPRVQGAVLQTREPDGLKTLSFTEAGIVGGKIGLNSAGVGLTINGLLSTADDWSRGVLPFHARCYGILRQRTLADAVSVVTAAGRACSANFLIAQAPDRAVDLEAAPDAVRELLPERGLLVHTNHFLDPDQLGVVEPESERRPHSYARQRRMRDLLEACAPVAIGDLELAFRDHESFPDGICRHESPLDPPAERCATVISAIMDLDARSLQVADGQPCERQYDAFTLRPVAVPGR